MFVSPWAPRSVSHLTGSSRLICCERPPEVSSQIYTSPDVKKYLRSASVVSSKRVTAPTAAEGNLPLLLLLMLLLDKHIIPYVEYKSRRASRELTSFNNYRRYARQIPQRPRLVVRRCHLTNSSSHAESSARARGFINLECSVARRLAHAIYITCTRYTLNAVSMSERAIHHAKNHGRPCARVGTSIYKNHSYFIGKENPNRKMQFSILTERTKRSMYAHLLGI
uniref:Uncharacterized protein n=1 Tax=Trichogramma kaykai TaxID=54128 RepID=A0ABD2VV93_9HYME